MIIKKHHIKFIFPVLVLPWVISCASGMSSQFSCQSAKQYGRCLSVSEIDQKIDNGELNGSESDLHIKPKAQPLPLPHHLNVMTDKAPSLHRHPEITQKIWIAPYEDSQGNYHQGSEVYTVLQPGYWENFSGRK